LEKLAALNRAMTRRRIAARSASHTVIEDFLLRTFEEGSLVACMSSNFDGIGASGRPDLAEHIVMLYGDNRVLRCCMANCRTHSEREAPAFDDRILAEGNVICEGCEQKSEQNFVNSPHQSKAVHLTFAARSVVR
jgi:hypothetical protein